MIMYLTIGVIVKVIVIANNIFKEKVSFSKFKSKSVTNAGNNA